MNGYLVSLEYSVNLVSVSNTNNEDKIKFIAVTTNMIIFLSENYADYVSLGDYNYLTKRETNRSNNSKQFTKLPSPSITGLGCLNCNKVSLSILHPRLS
jgi:hypothetical protein